MTKQELQAAKKKFGKNAQKIRKEKEMSLLDVSYNCSLGDGRISEIEHGKYNLTLSTILELAKGLEIQASKLFDY
jgi:transcriptional regulator with XRE-family HTH domain